MQESKREKFVRLAEARTNKIINMIQLLGNCSNKNIYEYSQQDMERIFAAIESELRATKRKFNVGGSRKNNKFTLGE